MACFAWLLALTPSAGAQDLPPTISRVADPTPIASYDGHLVFSRANGRGGYGTVSSGAINARCVQRLRARTLADPSDAPLASRLRTAARTTAALRAAIVVVTVLTASTLI